MLLLLVLLLLIIIIIIVVITVFVIIITTFTIFIRALNELENIESKKVPVFILGESLGGCVALHTVHCAAVRICSK